MKIVPAILETSIEEIEKKIKSLSSRTNEFQIDLCDGIYVETKTWPFVDMPNDRKAQYANLVNLSQYASQGISIELDCMIKNPELYMSQILLSAPKRVTVHVQSTERLEICLAVLRGYQEEKPNMQYGIAIPTNADTSIYQKYLKMVDFVQIMGIGHIGKQGEEFNNTTYDTIEKIKSIWPDCEVAVDGAVSLVNMVPLAEHGVRRVAIGSALWKSGDPATNFQQLLTALL